VRALVTLSHPHIVRIIDVGEEAHHPFAVLEYLSQGSLETRRPKRGGEGPAGVPVAEVAGWLSDVAKALDFIHGKGYVHRDVKPGNILFDREGHVYLADFGVAKALLAEPVAQGVSLPHTKTGFVLGTPEYMAPEIIMGQRYDGRADQYSLAATVYDVLSGRPPFEGQTPSALLVHHVTTAPRKLSEFSPGIGEEVADVVDKALAKHPDGRFPDCRSFARALLDAAERDDTSKETRSGYADADVTNLIEPFRESKEPQRPFGAAPDTASAGVSRGTAGPFQRWVSGKVKLLWRKGLAAIGSWFALWPPAQAWVGVRKRLRALVALGLVAGLFVILIGLWTLVSSLVPRSPPTPEPFDSSPAMGTEAREPETIAEASAPRIERTAPPPPSDSQLADDTERRTVEPTSGPSQQDIERAGPTPPLALVPHLSWIDG